VLDLGCGGGDPVATAPTAHGLRGTGVDVAPTMISPCRQGMSGQQWIVVELRTVALGERLEAVLAWVSVFCRKPTTESRCLPLAGIAAARLLPRRWQARLRRRAGTGMTDVELKGLVAKLRPLSSEKMPLHAPPPKNMRGNPLVLSRVHWVRPKLVAEVTYLTWAADGLLRHVVFQGLREDKKARDVRSAG
jgi:hypothetical protein